VLSGITEQTEGKKVVIYKPSRHAMTSGLGATRWWAIRFEKRHAWVNPLMGWVSSADTQSPVAMHTTFETAEEAIAFAERNGWRYELQRDYTRVPGRVDSAYAYNFVPVAVQVRGGGGRGDVHGAAQRVADAQHAQQRAGGWPGADACRRESPSRPTPCAPLSPLHARTPTVAVAGEAG